MEFLNEYLSNFLTILIKSIGGGIGFAMLSLEIKKAWKQEQKWKLASLFGTCIFGIFIIFKGL
ncbi:MAG: hypothetical protein KDK64_07935 [Chlamydiia bacterium]|nr:hypothetical protein [Chlamydiia bacterium]